MKIKIELNAYMFDKFDVVRSFSMLDGKKFGLDTSHLGLLSMVVRLHAMSSSRNWCVWWAGQVLRQYFFLLIIICRLISDTNIESCKKEVLM